LEDDEYLSLLHADPINSLSSAYAELSISFRSDGNQSRNSDSNSDLSDASILAYSNNNNNQNSTNLRSPLPDINHHKNNDSSLAMKLFDENSELISHIQADNKDNN